MGILEKREWVWEWNKFDYYRIIVLTYIYLFSTPLFTISSSFLFLKNIEEFKRRWKNSIFVTLIFRLFRYLLHAYMTIFLCYSFAYSHSHLWSWCNKKEKLRWGWCGDMRVCLCVWVRIETERRQKQWHWKWGWRALFVML